MAAQAKNRQEIEKARKLNHVPWDEEYEKMISGMLYVYPHFPISVPYHFTIASSTPDKATKSLAWCPVVGCSQDQKVS
jgi:hypothetical protein